MALAGYCRVCGQYVWLNDQWGCVNGHAWSEISNWYDPQTATAVTPYWLQGAPAAAAAPMPVAPAMPVAPTMPAPAPEPVAIPEPTPVAAPAPEPPPAPQPTPAPEPAPAPAPAGPSDRLTMLADMLATLGQYPNYHSQYGTDTDLVIDNQIADANWGTGKKKVEFSAIMKAVEAERTIYYWEMLKEQSSGLSFGGFESEVTTTSGMKRWGKTSETVIGPGGVVASYDWDYSATRRIVEDVAARHGWSVKVVLKRSSATW